MNGAMNWNVQVIPVGPLQMNSVLLTAPNGPDGPEAILIDPGEEAARLLTLVEKSGCKLKALLATHGHFDHVGAGAAIQEVHDLPLRCHQDDVLLIENMGEADAGLLSAVMDALQPQLVSTVAILGVAAFLYALLPRLDSAIKKYGA